MKIIIASLNPIKIKAVKIAFETMFGSEVMEFIGISAPSGVSEQPMSDIETREGAMNRVLNAEKDINNSDYYVGLEGGVEVVNNEMIAFAWMIIKSKNAKISSVRTATMVLPPKVKKLVEEGMELGHADDIVFNKSNSKQSNGAVGLLTNNKITRETYYIHALILALIPFCNEGLY